MGQCFSSCIKVPSIYKSPQNQAFQPHSSDCHPTLPTTIDVYNIIVEYDKNSNTKSKSMVQCQTMNKQVEDSNTSNQNNLSHQNYYHQNNSHNQNDSPHQNPHLSHNDTHLSETSLNSITASREGPINIPTDPVEEMYECYKAPDYNNLIRAEGVKLLCKDLNLPPQHRKILLLAWKFKASCMSRFSREEFVEGCRSLGVTSVQQLRSKLDEREEENKEELKKMYKWSYGWALESPKRFLSCDVALPLWSLVLQNNPPSLLAPWISFLQLQKSTFLISKDTWDLFLTLTETYKTTQDLLNRYTDQQAWPTLFDDFVVYLRLQQQEKLQQNKTQPTDVRIIDGKGSTDFSDENKIDSDAPYQKESFKEKKENNYSNEIYSHHTYNITSNTT